MLSGKERIVIPLKSSLVKEPGSANEVNLNIFLVENLEGKNSFNGRDVMNDVLATISSLWSNLRPWWCSNSIFRLSRFEQPSKTSSWSEFNLLISSGSSIRLVQFLRFKINNLCKSQIDSWIWTKRMQPSSISFSRPGRLEKSGVLIRSWEWRRLRTFNFERNCENTWI